MAQFYEMPAVSPTMEFGVIVAWRIPEGASFASSAVVAEVATDKANMEAEIFDAGVMLKHLVPEGAEVPAGVPIAIIGKALGEDISGLLAEYAARTAVAPAAAPAPAAVEAAPAPPVTPPPVAAAPVAAPTAPATPAPVGSIVRTWHDRPLSPLFADPPGDLGLGRAPAGRVVASPLARAAAAALGVDVAKVKGTGPGGRIVQADVEAASKAPAAPAASARADEVVKNTPMRKTIAKRLLASHADIPTFFLTISLDAAGMTQLREQLKAKDVKVSFNDIFVACVARALREYPKANAAWSADTITRFGRVDIGVAVAVNDGLITPVIRGADQRSLTDLSATTRELAGRAREGKLKPEEYTGSTFTISNLGMFDIEQFTAIINPPEAAILAVGSIAQVPVVSNGQLTVGARMKVTMTCDHRVIDGATGAEFLQVLRKYVETPVLLLA